MKLVDADVIIQKISDHNDVLFGNKNVWNPMTEKDRTYNEALRWCVNLLEKTEEIKKS